MKEEGRDRPKEEAWQRREREQEAQRQDENRVAWSEYYRRRASFHYNEARRCAETARDLGLMRVSVRPSRVDLLSGNDGPGAA